MSICSLVDKVSEIMANSNLEKASYTGVDKEYVDLIMLEIIH
nr:hypothetical protein [Mycoplasmopsis bovis]